MQVYLVLRPRQDYVISGFNSSFFFSPLSRPAQKTQNVSQVRIRKIRTLCVTGYIGFRRRPFEPVYVVPHSSWKRLIRQRIIMILIFLVITKRTSRFLRGLSCPSQTIS